MLNLYMRLIPMFDVDGDGSGGGTGGGGGNDPNPADKTFTQAELDEIIAQRLERERKKFADYDELKTKLADFEKAEDERKKAAMTEQERLKAEKDEAARQAEEAKEAAKAALESANKRLLKSEFKIRGASAGILADALDDAFVLADLTGVTIGDDGAVDEKALDTAITSLIEKKPFLKAVGKPNEPKPIGGPSGGGNDGEIKTLEAELEAARKAKNVSKVIEISNKIKTKLGK